MNFTFQVTVVVLLVLILATLAVGSRGLVSKEGFYSALKALRKSNVDSKLFGVCAGFGKYTPLPAWIWRVIFISLVFCGGAGLVVYFILAICMPSAQD